MMKSQRRTCSCYLGPKRSVQHQSRSVQPLRPGLTPHPDDTRVQAAEVKPAEIISKKKRKLLVKQKKEREKKGLRGEVLEQVSCCLSLSACEFLCCAAQINTAESETSRGNGIFKADATPRCRLHDSLPWQFGRAEIDAPSAALAADSTTRVSAHPVLKLPTQRSAAHYQNSSF
jgi:hypothetical protein